MWRKALANYWNTNYIGRHMRKADAVSYFKTQQKLADAVKRSQSTVAGWGEVVPLDHAFVLEKLTGGKLKVNPALYPKLPDGVIGRSRH